MIFLVETFFGENFFVKNFFGEIFFENLKTLKSKIIQNFIIVKKTNTRFSHHFNSIICVISVLNVLYYLIPISIKRTAFKINICQSINRLKSSLFALTSNQAPKAKSTKTLMHLLIPYHPE